jgi:hypothetical protein
MPIERKSYPIADFKGDDETGVIEAIVSVFNNVDHGKEIVRPGFFEKSIARKLPKGVWAHDWKQPIAKTIEAKELRAGDPQLPDHLRELGGTYIKGQFNLKTQRGREAYEDIKFGIIDEFSIGYAVIKDSKDEATGARELIEGDWKEWSPVLVGMNDQTALMSIKSDEEKGMLAEEMAQTTPSTWEVQSAFSRVIRKIAESAKNSDVTDLQFDWKAKATLACSELGSEMTPLVIAQIEEFLSSSDDEFYLKGITAPESFESFEATAPGLTKFVQKLRDFHEIRLKEGRILSNSNRKVVQDAIDALQALLLASEPKPKEKEMSVESLRIQSLRIRSQAIAALS